jgi:hypothetical protein
MRQNISNRLLEHSEKADSCSAMTGMEPEDLAAGNGTHKYMVYLSVYGCTALCWTLAAFQILNPIHSL